MLCYRRNMLRLTRICHSSAAPTFAPTPAATMTPDPTSMGLGHLVSQQTFSAHHGHQI